jgi:Mrp family chromosome partitioning ATPase
LLSGGTTASVTDKKGDTSSQREKASMSRHFELMTQLEIEKGATDNRAQVAGDRATAMAVPILSSHAGNVGGEEILRLVQHIFLSSNGSAPRQVVLCGVDDKNGSSSVCAMAGRTLAANSSRPICLVDANIRSPRLSGMFGVEGTNPFSGSSAPLHEQCVKIGGNLWFAGTNVLSDDRRVLLPPVQLKERLSQLRDEFEYILIDAPGTRVCGDAQLLSLVADAAILVIEANSTRRLTARKAKEILDAAGVQLLGAVLHNRSFPIPERLYNRL